MTFYVVKPLNFSQNEINKINDIFDSSFEPYEATTIDPGKTFNGSQRTKSDVEFNNPLDS